MISRKSLATALALSLAACGGDSSGTSAPPPTGGGNPTPTPTNTAPSFTSADTASARQADEGVIYTASATDADGDPVTFQLAGGADAARFVINPETGSLVLARASGQTPTGDLAVTLEADDGRGGVTQLALVVTVDSSVTSGNIIISTPGPSPTPTPTPPPMDMRVDTQIDRGIHYAFANGDAGEEILRFDHYFPIGNTADLPLIVIAHGGAFVGGAKTDLDELATDLVGRGFAVAAIDYRLIQNANISADDLAIGAARATHDLFGAVRFLRANSDQFLIDPDRIFVGGVSAGGVMASVAATLDANDTVSNSALADFLAANGGVFGEVGENDATSSAISGALSVAGAVLDLGTIDSNDAPVFMAHFELDSVVPCETGSEGALGTGLIVSGSCAMQPRLNGAGVPNDLFLVAGQDGHTNFSRDQINTFLNQAVALFGI